MDKKIIVAIIAIIAVVAVVACYISFNNSNSTTGTVQITDMLNRNVQVPAHINKVLATSPPLTNMVYMLAPDKLAGWNSNLTSEAKQYTPEKYQNLPVVGGWYSTFQGNPETFLSLNPDVILDDFSVMGNSSPSIDDMQKKMGSVPVVATKSSTNVTNYTSSIQFMGKVLGAQQQADKMVSFYNKVMNQVNGTASAIPEDQKVKVYYAEGAAGLQTDPKGSQHSQLIELCGGINVAQVPLKQGNGMSSVSMEQVLQWNPDIIITNNAQFYNSVTTNSSNSSSWNDVNAVKNHKVYLAPTAPLGWFDRPPGVNTIIGIPWTAKVLYPDKFKDIDMNSLTKEFYSDFYHVTLTDNDVKNIMSNQTI